MRRRAGSEAGWHRVNEGSAAEGQSSAAIEQLQALLAASVQLKRWWTWTMVAAAVLSTLRVERVANGDLGVTFRLTALTAILLALIWLPAVLRVIVVGGGSIKTPAGEATTRGLLDVLGSLDAETKRDTLPSVLAALTSPEAFASSEDRAAIRVMRREVAAELAAASAPLRLGGVREGLHRYAREYERVRETEPPGHERTMRLTTLTAEARALARTVPLSTVDIRHLLDSGGEGDRVIALVLAQDQPDARLFDLINDAIRNSRSAFEQYHALGAAYEMLALLSVDSRRQLLRTLEAVLSEPRFGIEEDASRKRLVEALSRQIRAEARSD